MLQVHRGTRGRAAAGGGNRAPAAVQLAREPARGSQNAVVRTARVVDHANHLRVGQRPVRRDAFAEPIDVGVPQGSLGVRPGLPGRVDRPPGQGERELLDDGEGVADDSLAVVFDRVEPCRVDRDDLHVVAKQRP